MEDMVTVVSVVYYSLKIIAIGSIAGLAVWSNKTDYFKATKIIREAGKCEYGKKNKRK